MNDVDEVVAQPDESEIEIRPWWQSKLNLGALAVAIAVLCGALGWVVGNNRAIPDPNPVDIGFLQDMRTIAREIVFGQSIEIGRMIELLRIYGATEANESDVAMTWMNEPTPNDRMPGLASDADIDKLLASRGNEADTLFADLMIAHHQGGIHMAQYAQDHAHEIEVRRFANGMITGQTGEIDELRALIAA